MITERNGREITVYMRTELLSEITVANLFIAARMADLLPEHGACLLHASFVLHEGKTNFRVTWDGRMLPCGMFPTQG